jgi:hypothetical protein
MFRVFIGGWDEDAPNDPDWVVTQCIVNSWGAAAAMLIEHLEAFRNIDYCDQCRTDAIEGIEKLKTMPPGSFEVSVNGDDYMIFANG